MKPLTPKHLEQLKGGSNAAISAAYHHVYGRAVSTTNADDWNLFIDHLDDAYPGWRGRPNPPVVWRPIEQAA